ncbi:MULTISPECIES: SRPBCC family protein [Actibacterium]|uniref:Putative membrane protein n=1 Tax=Actibacterium naphthalenivorans TaxID=1614693 RepID=A0A840CHP2_9RHOB|nr:MULTISPECIES: SRPBCC family protein [Actibacterium]ALG91353.1 cyclase [Actibacterium sp. EMB200-NS6]MBB4022759.1 putative membrane protein [Actibacterium naphthalenivorans]
MPPKNTPPHSAVRAVAVSVCVGLLAAGAASLWLSSGRNRQDRRADDAPGRTGRLPRYGDYAVVGKTVTINSPRHELYAFWREFKNLPRFMENVEAVEASGDTLVWTIRGPAGSSYTLRTRIISDRKNEQIAWRSIDGSDIDTEGKVMFRDAPGGRGTEVEAIIAYVPPGGAAGRAIARLFRREPAVQGRHELKRFKMLMETGEVATANNRKLA